MPVTSAINYDVVKVGLNKVFYQNFQLFTGPNVSTVDTPAVFKQDTADNSAVIMEIFKGSGLWKLRGEQQDVPSNEIKVGNKQVFSVEEWANSLDLSYTFFKDNMYGVYEKMVKNFADNARKSQNNNGFKLYRNLFTTTLTADGVAAVSASHTTLEGETVSNILTSSAFSESTLNDAIVKLSEMKDQNGTICGEEAVALVVPQALYQKAVIATESKLRSGTANNDINVYSDKYGISVYTSPYLGANAGGSDTNWFLLGRNHSITRWVREGVHTDLVDYKYQRNNNYIFKGAYREVYGVPDYIGIVGAQA